MQMFAESEPVLVILREAVMGLRCLAALLMSSWLEEAA